MSIKRELNVHVDDSGVLSGEEKVGIRPGDVVTGIDVQ